MVTGVKEEVFELTQATTGVSGQDLTYATADGSLQTAWEYLVPVGYAIVFTAEDIISAYLEDAV